MTRDEFLQIHWEYYLLLEEDFMGTTRYVELDQANFNTFSKEYYKMFMSICMESEALMKAISGVGGNAYSNIGIFGAGVLNKYPDIINKEVNVNYTNIILKPYSGWLATAARKTLNWWDAYDDAKHDRVAMDSKANLENVINALAGLYILEYLYLNEIVDVENEPNVPDELSRLFTYRDDDPDWVAQSTVFYKMTKV